MLISPGRTTFDSGLCMNLLRRRFFSIKGIVQHGGNHKSWALTASRALSKTASHYLSLESSATKVSEWAVGRHVFARVEKSDSQSLFLPIRFVNAT